MDTAERLLGLLGLLQLPTRLRPRLDALATVTVASAIPTRSTAVDRRIVMALAHAASSRKVTTFDYVDGRGAASRRHVEPVRLVRSGHAWYLAAFDVDRDEWRTFRLDRISSVSSGRPGSGGDVHFAPRPGPDPVELVVRAAPPSAFEHQATIVVDATPADVRALVPVSIAVAEPELGQPAQPRPASSTITIGTDDLDWLAGYLMGLPWAFEVIGPPALRQRIARRAAELAARHAALT